MRDRQTCIDCAKLSPETETNYTLISAQFGWRLSRKRHADGTFMVEWRCPDCWRIYKSAKVQVSADGSTPWTNPPTPIPSEAPPPPSPHSSHYAASNPTPPRAAPPPLPTASGSFRAVPQPPHPPAAPPSAGRIPAPPSRGPVSTPPRPPTKPSR